MRKILALLIAIIMLLALSSCDKEKENNAEASMPTNTESSPADTDISTDITGATEETTRSTEDNQTAHQHSYNFEVTTAATCTSNGVMTFICSCGDSYTEAIVTAGHTWSDWNVERYALIGKNGTDKRICSVCSESEVKESTANAIHNSFYDGGLIRILNHSYGKIDATSLLEYACREFHEYVNKPTAASAIYAALAQRFDISNIFGGSLPIFNYERFGYDAVNDTYTLHDYGDTATIALLGYIHQGGNRYDVYYTFTPDGIDATLTYKVALEYNKLDGNPNKYLTIDRVSAPPSDMLQ